MISGWPKAWAVFNLAKEVYSEKIEELTDKDRYQNTIFFPIGDPNDGFAQYFDGQSYLTPVSTEQIPIFNVTFEPGCRNHWHGAAPDSWFSHLAIEIQGEDAGNEWCESVSEEDYTNAVRR